MAEVVACWAIIPSKFYDVTVIMIAVSITIAVIASITFITVSTCITVLIILTFISVWLVAGLQQGAVL